MNKQLLIDYIPFKFSPEQINESIAKHNGKLIVRGVIQRADAKNYNGRIYPKPILEREIKKYSQVQIAENRAMGELDHPESTVVNLQNVSHTVTECHWEGDDVVGTIEVLNTPSGNILKELFRSGITLGISSRGLGSVKQIDENTVEVQDDFDFVCVDFVSSPSTKGAYMTPVNESINKNIKNTDKYSKINECVRDIIIAYNTKD